jgi:hypothetical protein
VPIIAVAVAHVFDTRYTAAVTAGRLVVKNRSPNALGPSALASKGRKLRQRMKSSPRLEQLEGHLLMSTFVVNTTLDTVAVNLRTGRDAAGHVSLRSAVMAANARGGSSTSATLTLAPRLGARRGSRQSSAVDTVTANQANRGLGGPGGAGGGASGGLGAAPGGRAGQAFPGMPAAAGAPGAGVGGGLDLLAGGVVTIDNTAISGNNSSTPRQRRLRHVLGLTQPAGPRCGKRPARSLVPCRFCPARTGKADPRLPAPLHHGLKVARLAGAEPSR